MKCARPTCFRQEQTAGLCKPHYRLTTRGMPTGKMDPAPVIDHIKTLAAAGISNARLGQLCGISQNNIWAIVNGRRKRILASTAAKILGVPIPQAAWAIANDGATVPLIGTQRRLRALMAFGYPGRMIAERIGVRHSVINKVTAGSQQYVTAEVARAVAELFDELQLTPGPSKISRRRAAARGWAPPLAWDEGSIDNPNAKPDEVKPTRITQVDQYRELRYLGFHDDEIATRLGIERHWLNVIRQKAS